MGTASDPMDFQVLFRGSGVMGQDVVEAGGWQSVDYDVPASLEHTLVTLIFSLEGKESPL
jgi:hypothetical protein